MCAYLHDKPRLLLRRYYLVGTTGKDTWTCTIGITVSTLAVRRLSKYTSFVLTCIKRYFACGARYGVNPSAMLQDKTSGLILNTRGLSAKRRSTCTMADTSSHFSTRSTTRCPILPSLTEQMSLAN